ncbi:hypothetical protein [Dictyobacter vulcani]|nr:hypothetical protein [Dictyobacter vulcani]
MDTNAWWYVNGRWVHPQEANISINDVAVLRGYSVFESYAPIIVVRFIWMSMCAASIVLLNLIVAALRSDSIICGAFI